LACGTAMADIPAFKAQCPANHAVNADRQGTVHINGHVAEVTRYNDNYYEAVRGDVVIGISIEGGGLNVTYSGRGKQNGVCTVTRQQHDASASPIPDVGMSPDVSNAAVDACRRKLDAETDGNIDIVASEFSQANSAVYMVVGTNRAPWRCLVSNDGKGAELMFLGKDG
jgi:hypothetical protein